MRRVGFHRPRNVRQFSFKWLGCGSSSPTFDPATPPPRCRGTILCRSEQHKLRQKYTQNFGVNLQHRAGALSQWQKGLEKCEAPNRWTEAPAIDQACEIHRGTLAIPEHRSARHRRPLRWRPARPSPVRRTGSHSPGRGKCCASRTTDRSTWGGPHGCTSDTS